MRIVAALGGNALLRNGEALTAQNQRRNVRTAAEALAPIAREHALIVTHGNGPQVGFILRRSELAYEAGELHFVPLKNCVADTQGAIGYQICQTLDNELRRRGINKTVAALVTQTVVDDSDPEAELAETEGPEDLFADEAEDYIDLAAELEEELAAEETVVEVTGTQRLEPRDRVLDQQRMFGNGIGKIPSGLSVPAGYESQAMCDILDLDIYRCGVEEV